MVTAFRAHATDGKNPARSIQELPLAAPAPGSQDASPGTPGPAITGWKDVSESVRQAARSDPGFAIQDGVIRHTSEGTQIRFSIVPAGVDDYAVRVRYTGGTQIDLRETAGKDTFSVLASLEYVSIAHLLPGAAKEGEWSRVPHPAGYDPTVEHELVVAAQGPRLRVWVDGLLVDKLNDGLPVKGPASVSIPSGSAVHRVAMAGLPPPGALDSLPSTDMVHLADKDAPFVNGLGMKFVPVPVTAGSTGGQRVLFSIWKTRVQDYEVFVKETKHEWPKADFSREATHPAVRVSWEDAQSFCAWLTARERRAGQIGMNEKYRLPGDHEWSCAVGLGDLEDSWRAPDGKDEKLPDVFPWGNAWPPPAEAGNYGGEEIRTDVASKKLPGFITGYTDRFPHTSPVGSFAANRFGLYDAGGNAWEWCEDWYSSGHTERVTRGASWINYQRLHLLASKRNHVPPSNRSNNCGFRVVLAWDSSDFPPGSN